MLFSIIIPTANRFELLCKCVDSIRNQSIKDYEIIVIDQSDKEITETMKALLKDCCYIYTPVKGLSRARNIGIRSSRGSFICIMDDDAQYAEGFFQRVLEQNRDGAAGVDIFCGKVLDKNTGEVFARGMSEKDITINFSNIMDICVSTSLVIKREVFQKSGMFDEDFGVGAIFGAGEETDFLLRALYDNKVIRYCHEPVVYHPAPAKKLDAAALGKIYQYGIGQGALDCKHFYLYKNKQLFNSDLKMYTRTLLGFFKYLFIDFKIARSRIAYLKGVIRGFYQFRRKLGERQYENRNRC